MDDGEDLLNNCHVVPLTQVWNWLIQYTRPFYIHYVLPVPLLSKIHILISQTSSLCLLLFRAVAALQYPGLKKREREKTFYSQTRSSIFIPTNPFCFPFVGQMLERQPPPQDSPFLDIVGNGMLAKGFPFHIPVHLLSYLALLLWVCRSEKGGVNPRCCRTASFALFNFRSSHHPWEVCWNMPHKGSWGSLNFSGAK